MFYDPQDEAPETYCCYCGDEIYRGDRVWEVDEGLLHTDDACVFGYLTENCCASDLMRQLRLRQVAAGMEE